MTSIICCSAITTCDDLLLGSPSERVLIPSLHVFKITLRLPLRYGLSDIHAHLRRNSASNSHIDCTMGWWWSSSPQKDELSSPAATPARDTAQSRTLTRDEQQAEDEFKKLFAAFESSNANKDNATSPKSLDPSSSTPTTESSADQQPQPSSIAPESLYQDTMSCRSAFDYAFFCQSFGGQFVNVYRYGELRSCSEHWDNFWLCMRTRSWGENERRKAIRDHNRKKAIKYKTGPSSEDVWDMRTHPVQNAFQGDFVALEREMQAEEEAGGAGARV